MSTQSRKQFSVFLLVIDRGNATVHILSPPVLNELDFLCEIGITLTHLELYSNGVLDVRGVLCGVSVVLFLKERRDHNHIVHTEQISVEGGLQSVIFGSVILPVLDTLGGLHFKNRVYNAVLINAEVVPHTAKMFAFGEEIAPSGFEIILTVTVGRSNDVHTVGLLHVLCLFGFDCLTCLCVDSVLKRDFVCLGNRKPHFKRRRPRVQTEDCSKARTCDFLRALRWRNLELSAFKPFHYSLPPSSIAVIF